MRWTRHDQAPWYERPAPAEYGAQGSDGLWLVLTRQSAREGKGRHWFCWKSLTPLRGDGTNLVLVLFETRTLEAAKALAELHASTTEEVRPMSTAPASEGG